MRNYDRASAGTRTQSRAQKKAPRPMRHVVHHGAGRVRAATAEVPPLAAQMRKQTQTEHHMCSRWPSQISPHPGQRVLCPAAPHQAAFLPLPGEPPTSASTNSSVLLVVSIALCPLQTAFTSICSPGGRKPKEVQPLVSSFS